MRTRTLKVAALGLGLAAALAPCPAQAQADGARALPAPGGAGLARRRPPPPHEISSVARCKARLVDPLRQQRCLSCVGRGGIFHEQLQGAGFCVERDQKLRKIRRVRGCTFHLGQGGDGKSCRSCLEQGGIYRTWAKGKGDCSRPRLAAPRLKAAGSQAGPPAPGAAEARSLRLALQRGLGDDQACRAGVPQAPLQRRCQRCVEQGGWYYPGRKVCGPPQMVAPVHTLAECALRLNAPDPLARCRECVRQGGKFYPGGYCQVKPAPLPAEQGSLPEEAPGPP